VTFDEAFTRVLGHEGGYSNNPSDPGGETNWGISKRSYPELDIRSLTKEAAKDIYRLDFWQPTGLVNAHPGVVFQLFDFAVNSGIQTATRAYQRALGVADDGYFGPVSKKAALMTSETDLVMRILAERLDFMTRLSGWTTYGRGWAQRVANDLRYGALDT
jgi:lysozyme family protein